MVKERTARKKIAHSLGIEDKGLLFYKKNQPQTHICGGSLRLGIDKNGMTVVWCLHCHKIVEKFNEKNGDISPLRAAVAVSNRC
jgi:hypothetical protein